MAVRLVDTDSWCFRLAGKTFQMQQAAGDRHARVLPTVGQQAKSDGLPFRRAAVAADRQMQSGCLMTVDTLHSAPSNV